MGALLPLPTLDRNNPKITQLTKEEHTRFLNDSKATSSALERFLAFKEGPSGASRAKSLQLKNFIDAVTDVSRTVGQLTAECDVSDLQIALKEKKAKAAPACESLLAPDGVTTLFRGSPEAMEAAPAQIAGVAGFVPIFRREVAAGRLPPMGLPLIPREDVKLTQPIALGQCAVVMKEVKGLKMDAFLGGLSPWVEPWNVRIPITRFPFPIVWKFVWTHAEFVKTITFCNRRGVIRTSVDQRVILEPALAFFWEMFPKDP